MLSELKMKLRADERITYYQTSNLQGVLMQHIDTLYANMLHESQLKPYSMCLLQEDGYPVWIVRTLTDEARKQIIEPLQSAGFCDFLIERKHLHVEITEKTCKDINPKELLNEFYGNDKPVYFDLSFETPTSFKSYGKYMIFPDIELLYKSLMNKINITSENMEMFDDDTLEQLVLHSEISKYRLRSGSFPLEGIRIPSFQGELTVKINGAATMTRYARLLFKFGEFSGVGIKTAIGMGSLKVNNITLRNNAEEER